MLLRDGYAAPSTSDDWSRLLRHILFVDDDVEIHWVISDILSSVGYMTTSIARSSTAFKALAERASDFDLLLTDVVLPGGSSGIDIVHLWRRMCPGKPVIYISGHAASASTLLPNDETLLHKPFTAPQLLNAVATSLGLD